MFALSSVLGISQRRYTSTADHIKPIEKESQVYKSQKRAELCVRKLCAKLAADPDDLEDGDDLDLEEVQFYELPDEFADGGGIEIEKFNPPAIFHENLECKRMLVQLVKDFQVKPSVAAYSLLATKFRSCDAALNFFSD